MFEQGFVPYIKPEWVERGNVIGPGAMIDARADIGRDNYFGPGTIVGPGVTIGDRNRFEAHVMVGTPPESRGKFTQWNLVRIGDGNIFREFVTVHAGVRRATSVHNGVCMLTKSHLGHDAVLEDDVMVSCAAMIGGHTHVMRGANIGLSAVIHQQQVIGSWSMVGMGSVVAPKSLVAPGVKVMGAPSRAHGMNQVGLDRMKVRQEMLDAEELRFMELHEAFGRKFRIREEA